MSSKAYVIVGAGHAARRAAEALRERDAEIDIVMFGDEVEHPYDRPVLSKDALIAEDGEKKAFIRDAAWYRSQRIDVRLGVAVASIDRIQQQVILADGTQQAYHRLLLATGSRVRPYPGDVERGVALHYVRTLADTRALRKRLVPGKRVAILGGGFIGLEVAASARSRGCEVVLLEAAERLLMRTMPEAVGRFVDAMHRHHGVDIALSTQVSQIRHAGNGLAVLETNHGEVQADIVVVGIGVVPNVELAADAGLSVANGIVVDPACRTADPAIFAAGEVSNQFNTFLGRPARIESWQIAENQPVVAAANMLGANEHYGEIPWLWSDQYDCNIQTLGAFDLAAHIVVRGEPETGVLTVFGLADIATRTSSSQDDLVNVDVGAEQRLVAVASVNNGRDIAVCRRLMQAAKPVLAACLADPSTVLRKLL